MRKFLICFSIFVFFQDFVFAQHNPDASINKWGITPVALPTYSSETLWTLSGGLIYYNNPHSENKEALPDQITAYGQVSQKKQAAAGISTERYYNDEKFKLYLNFKYSNWPSQFWGIGRDTKDNMKENYKEAAIVSEGSFMYQAAKFTYIGPFVRYNFSRIRDRKENGLLSRQITGWNGMDEFGIGFHLCMDTRDMSFYPHKGLLFEIKDLQYSDSIKSDHTFNLLDINGRHYIRLKGEHVLALQYIARLASGQVPFQLLNYYDIRGYNSSRYIDKIYLAANTEYRFPLFWRIGGAVFAGAGEIARNFSQLDIISIKPAAGLGLRAILDRDEHINLRLDFGFGNVHNYGAYLNLGEAF